MGSPKSKTNILRLRSAINPSRTRRGLGLLVLCSCKVHWTTFRSTIDCSPNKLIVGMKDNTGLSLIAPEQEHELPSVIREIRRLDTQVSIDFAANAAKEVYDSHFYHPADKNFECLRKPDIENARLEIEFSERQTLDLNVNYHFDEKRT
jgi:hypothetical protein